MSFGKQDSSAQSEQSTRTEGQEDVLQQLLDLYSPSGTGPRDPVIPPISGVEPATQTQKDIFSTVGDYATDLKPLQDNASIPLFGEATGATSKLLSGDLGANPITGDFGAKSIDDSFSAKPIEGVSGAKSISGDFDVDTLTPDQVNDFFDRAIAEPARFSFEDIQRPLIREEFAGPGFSSSARAQEVARQGQDVERELGSARAGLEFDVLKQNQAIQSQNVQRELEVASRNQQNEQQTIATAVEIASRNQLNEQQTVAVATEIAKQNQFNEQQTKAIQLEVAKQNQAVQQQQATNALNALPAAMGLANLPENIRTQRLNDTMNILNTATFEQLQNQAVRDEEIERFALARDLVDPKDLQILLSLLNLNFGAASSESSSSGFNVALA